MLPEVVVSVDCIDLDLQLLNVLNCHINAYLFINSESLLVVMEEFYVCLVLIGLYSRSREVI
jgi:hypothetical protein